MHSCLQFLLCLVVFGNASADNEEKWNEFKSKYGTDLLFLTIHSQDAVYVGIIDYDVKSKECTGFLSLQGLQRVTELVETAGKQYKDAREEQRRLNIFRENMAAIEAHNVLFKQGKSSFTMGMNKYSDMESSERLVYITGYVPRDPFEEMDDSQTYVSNDEASIPDAVDWRDKGYVSPVKDQGLCRSCWAFAATGTLEGQHFRKTGILVSLSEQQLVDCSKANNGCDGGYAWNALTHIRRQGGIDTEASYPYEDKKGECRFNNLTIGATCRDYVVVPRNESMLKRAVANRGPIAASIDAEHTSFENYEDGVYDEPACRNTINNHAVLVVGYGVNRSTGVEYWIVKNSYGTSWGKEGYILMSRNKDNQCGISNRPIYAYI